MKKKSELSICLYETMLERGYPEEFCDIITQNLNTDFTAKMMMGYLGYFDSPPLEQVVDEMLAILSLREKIIKKKAYMHANAAWNEMRWSLFRETEDESEQFEWEETK